jgi:hypothetical protein
LTVSEIFQITVTRGVKAVLKIGGFVFITIHLESFEMTNTSTTDNAPQLDRSKVRKFREIARYTLEECVLESDLQEDWRRIERGEFREIGRDFAYDMALFLGCEIDDLLTKRCPDSGLPEVVSICDTESWAYSPEPESGLRLKVEPIGRRNFLRVNCEDATPEEIEVIWAMLTKGVTS